MDPEVILDELEQGSAPGNQDRLVAQMSFDQLIGVDSASLDQASEAARVELVPKPRKKNGKHHAEHLVTGRHQDLRLYLTVLLKTYAEMTDAGLVREAPYQVQVTPGNVLHPDIVFISNMNFERVHETYVEGAPDIIIEVVAPATAAMDRGEKFITYESLGVREYWMIDPLRELVSFYHLGPDGLYDEVRPDINGRFRSRVLKGFLLDVDRLWRRLLPTTTEIVDLAESMVRSR